MYGEYQPDFFSSEKVLIKCTIIVSYSVSYTGPLRLNIVDTSATEVIILTYIE